MCTGRRPSLYTCHKRRGPPSGCEPSPRGRRTRPQKLTLGALDKDTTHLQALAAACDVKALRDLKIWVFDHSFVPWLGLFHQCAAQLATFHITGVGLSAFSEDPTGSGLPEMPLLTHLKMDVSPTEQCLKQLIKLVESVKLDTLDLRGFDWRFKWNILRATQGTIRKLFTWGWETDYAEHLPALKIIELFSDYDRWTQDGIVPPAPDLPQTLEVLHLGRCSSRSRQDRVLRTWLSDATWLPNLKIITADFSGDYYETCPASPALEEICAQRGLKVTFIEPAEGFVPRIVHVVDD